MAFMFFNLLSFPGQCARLCYLFSNLSQKALEATVIYWTMTIMLI